LRLQFLVCHWGAFFVFPYYQQLGNFITTTADHHSVSWWRWSRNSQWEQHGRNWHEQPRAGSLPWNGLNPGKLAPVSQALCFPRCTLDVYHPQYLPNIVTAAARCTTSVRLQASCTTDKKPRSLR